MATYSYFLLFLLVFIFKSHNNNNITPQNKMAVQLKNLMVYFQKGYILRHCLISRFKHSVSSRTSDNLELNFDDYRTAFKSKSTLGLLRALTVYNLCSVKYLVDNNDVIMKRIKKTLGKRLFSSVMKMTFYGHFVGLYHF